MKYSPACTEPALPDTRAYMRKSVGWAMMPASARRWLTVAKGVPGAISKPAPSSGTLTGLSRNRFSCQIAAAPMTIIATTTMPSAFESGLTRVPLQCRSP